MGWVSYINYIGQPAESPYTGNDLNNKIRGLHSSKNKTLNKILTYGYEEVNDLILKCDAYKYEPVSQTSENKNQKWNVADISST